ncbi:helix-turn-helix domain-containing protein [Streptomyces sp. NPDC094448]|uniref:helix-turn-helix domain-containing protein n=1 Tax=Streptomyces sp. NPDC094448 TaxID=3366063 RepID=UPI0038011237
MPPDERGTGPADGVTRPPAVGTPTLITSVQRALRLLEAASSYPAGAPAKVLARVATIPLPTAYHLLRTLVHEGYLRRESGVFVLGDAVGRLGPEAPEAPEGPEGPEAPKASESAVSTASMAPHVPHVPSAPAASLVSAVQNRRSSPEAGTVGVESGASGTEPVAGADGDPPPVLRPGLRPEPGPGTRPADSLEHWRDAIGAPVYFGVYRDGEIQVVAVSDTPYAPAVSEWADFRETGHAHAIGQCLLGRLDTAELHDHLDRHPVRALTPYSVRDRRSLLERLVARGRAEPVVERQEYTLDTVCAAIAVPPPAGARAAAMAISLPLDRSERLLPAIGQLRSGVGGLLGSLAFAARLPDA